MTEWIGKVYNDEDSSFDGSPHAYRVGSRDTFTPGQLKSVLTSERVNLVSREGEPHVNCVCNKGTSQIIIVDHNTGNIQVAFTPSDGPTDDVIFTDIGHY